MLKRKEPKEPDKELVRGVDSARKLLMHRGYFVRDVITVSDSEIDIVAIREGLLDSERMLMRIVLPDKKGGLDSTTAKRFFSSQEKVFNLNCVLISLSHISRQTLRFIKRREYSVYGEKWLKENTDFYLYSSDE